MFAEYIIIFLIQKQYKECAIFLISFNWQSMINITNLTHILVYFLSISISIVNLFKSTAYFYDIVIRQFYTETILFYMLQLRNKIEYRCNLPEQLHGYILEQEIRNDLYRHIDYVRLAQRIAR